METVVATRNPYAKLVTQFRATAPPRVTPEGAWVAVHTNIDVGFSQVYDDTEIVQWGFPAAEAVSRALAHADVRSAILFGTLVLGEPQASLAVCDVYQLDEDVQWEREPYAARYAHLCDLFGGCEVRVQRLHTPAPAAAAATASGRVRHWAAVKIAEPDDAAFEDVLGQSIPELERYLRGKMPNVKAEDAEDAAQDAVTKALLSYRGQLGSRPRPGDPLLPWLRTIALRTLKDIWKRGGKAKKDWEQKVFGGMMMDPVTGIERHVPGAMEREAQGRQYARNPKPTPRPKPRKRRDA
ncbi:MAG TPA: hypothetical protein VM221_10120 [Armatimonadota bacterium]|nr:hypothetical protein [Armatimonadota bacterium]